MSCHAGPLLIPGTILVTSLLGSLHCVGMCGGLVVSTCKSKWDHLAYHGGRGIMYMLFGAIAGHIGAQLNHTPILTEVAGVAIGVTMIIIGLYSWKKNSAAFHLPKPIAAVLTKPLSWIHIRYHHHRRWPLSGMVGAASAFLPCGWLYMAVFAAATTSGALQGALTMMLFWIGTLPALLLGVGGLQKLAAPLLLKTPRVTALMMMGIGIVTVVIKLI